MARIRSVHPGLFTDEAFVTASPMARLLWIGIWTECDDQGVFEWKPITLKMRLLPVDNADVGALLEELAHLDMVRRYTVEGRHYGAVRNFTRFQRPKKPNSTYPIPDEFRTYLGSSATSSEPDDDEEGGSSPPQPRKPPPVPPNGELDRDEVTPVPPNAEISPQMEDGGWREGKRDTSLRSVSRSETSSPPLFDDHAGSEPDDDPTAALFRRGLPALASLCGKPEKSVRGFLGTLRKDAGNNDAAVLEAIDAAVAARPAEPQSWLRAAVRTRVRRPRSIEDEPWFAEVATQEQRSGRWCVGGYYIDDAIEMVREAARIPDAETRDWEPLARWLHAGRDLHDDILPAIRRSAARAGHQPPASLRFFDGVITRGNGGLDV